MLVLTLVILGIATATPAAGCGMTMDPAPSGSVAAPDCCTDRSCPRMTIEMPHPEGIVSTPSAWAPPVSVARIGEGSPASIAPLLAFPPRLFRDGLLGPPLRI